MDKNDKKLQTLYNNYINIARKWYFVTLIKVITIISYFSALETYVKDENISTGK
jgi:hypothetical protein